MHNRWRRSSNLKDADRQSQGTADRRVSAARSGQVVFTYFHFAAERLTRAVMKAESSPAYETIKDANGRCSHR